MFKQYFEAQGYPTIITTPQSLEFRDGRVFAATGSFEDESNPDSGHGWMTRLVDAGVLTVAGFSRVRRAELQV